MREGPTTINKSSRYQFTIFTPCYNSEEFIHRVFKSIDGQIFRNFEWYVINDGSTDKTHDLITDYISKTDIPVNYFNLEFNQGLLKNLDLAIKNAKGKYIVFLGHDDVLLNHALDEFNTIIEEHDSEEISAIYALAKDQNGNLVGNRYPRDFQISDYWTQIFSLNNERDKIHCHKVKYLREFYPLFKGEKEIFPSSWLWGSIGTKYKAIFVNEILRVYYTNVSTSITNSIKSRQRNALMLYNYYLVWVNDFQYYIFNNRFRRIRGIVAYVSYGMLLKKSLKAMLRSVEKWNNKIIILIFLPLAIIYNLRHK